MKKDKKPYNPAAYPLFGIRLSPHPLQFIVMSHLRVQFVLHLFKEVGATVAFPAFDVRIEAVAVFGLHTEKGIEDRWKSQTNLTPLAKKNLPTLFIIRLPL